MGLAVLISVQPLWCVLIARGEKTIEVRKNRPKLKTPFKCYMYCTKTGGKVMCRPSQQIGSGKIIGEFVCDSIDTFGVPYPAFMSQMDRSIMEASCLSYWQLHRYAYHDALFAWHISDLKIYDKPRELSEFKQCHKCEYYKGCMEHEYSCDGAYALLRPPQSWMYVEELT